MFIAQTERGLLQIDPLLKLDNTQTWATTSCSIEAVPNRPFNDIVLNPTNAPLSFATHQLIDVEIPPPSAIFHNRCDGPSPYRSKRPLSESVNAVQDQPPVNRLQQMANHELIT